MAEDCALLRSVLMSCMQDLRSCPPSFAVQFSILIYSADKHQRRRSLVLAHQTLGNRLHFHVETRDIFFDNFTPKASALTTLALRRRLPSTAHISNDVEDRTRNFFRIVNRLPRIILFLFVLICDNLLFFNIHVHVFYSYLFLGIYSLVFQDIQSAVSERPNTYAGLDLRDHWFWE